MEEDAYRDATLDSFTALLKHKVQSQTALHQQTGVLT